jgi:ubiquinone/menaquinone biosynthesis C-methylase UbiE
MREFKKRQVYFEVIKIIKEDVSNGKSDIDIFLHINNFLIEHNLIECAINVEKRLLNRINDFSILLENDLFKIDSYLDFGCDDATITKILGSYIGLTKDKIYGVDISQCTNNNITFIKQEYNNSHVNLPNNSIYLVTMLMVLHHLENPIDLLGEMYRIMKPGGLLIIREHDIDINMDPDGKIFLDILHLYYDYVYNNPSRNNNIDSYSKITHYRSRQEWTNMITSIGFKRIDTDDRINTLYNISDIERKYSHKAKIDNPYHFYYGVYRKPAY